MTLLEESTLAEQGPYQASKWLAIQALLDVDEMQALLSELGPELLIFSGSEITARGQSAEKQSAFLETYAAYIEALKSGSVPEVKAYRSRFSDMWTCDPKCLYVLPLDADRQLIKPRRPVIQLQVHSLAYSSVDHKFRPMVSGTESITWGIQFSFPQIFQDPATRAVFQVNNPEEFPNLAVFRRLQRWLRHHSQPTTFEVAGEKQTVPMRIGKSCLSWIHKHPQLVQKGISVGL